MTQETRGGNSRLLARHLDQASEPIAVLDGRGVIVFVNSAICQMAETTATQLVGQRCSWHVAADQASLASVLTLLAPPASAREGRIVCRQLTTPPVFGSTVTGQLFVPLPIEGSEAFLTIVYLGDWEQIRIQQPTAEVELHTLRREEEKGLVSARSRWKTLDGLHALFGCSPAIELAMSRAQLALGIDCNTLLSGPVGVGKMDVAQGIFTSRMKAHGLQPAAGKFFPVDCAVLDVTLFEAMLDVFAGRASSDAPRASQNLMLENLDQLHESSVAALVLWLQANSSRCLITSTSIVAGNELSQRGPQWAQLMSRLSETEIHLPALNCRTEDIAPLAVNVLAEICASSDRPPLILTDEAIDLLCAYPWPTNLKQLSEAIGAAVKNAVLTKRIQPTHLPTAIRTFPSTVDEEQAVSCPPIRLDDVLTDMERIIIRRALKQSPRNRAQAARLLGISRPRLLRRIEQLGLSDTPVKGDAQQDEPS